MSDIHDNHNRIPVIQIKMFGEFSLKNAEYEMVASKQNGLTGFLLIAYLLSNKGVDITTDSLIDVLWPTEKSTNPAGALRTLIYRTRKMLSEFLTEQDTELIKRINNICSWNFEVPCSIDVYEFESLYHRATREVNPEEKYHLFEQAFSLYKGEFLPLFSHHSWVIFRNNYYGNLFINCVNQMCRYLESIKDYEQMLALCERALDYAPATDESLHKQKINALLYLNKPQTALDYYNSIIKMFIREHGLDISDSLHNVYQKILSSMPNQYQSMSALEANLRHREHSAGSFYCNFDIFQNIYQINLRSARRSQRLRYLILLTLKDSENPHFISDALKEEMEILQQIMEKKLRSNDVYTKSSICQYSLIIAATNEAGCDVVKNRLWDNYDKKKKHASITLTIESKEIW